MDAILAQIEEQRCAIGGSGEKKRRGRWVACPAPALRQLHLSNAWLSVETTQ
nr:hypothetical protein [Oceanococcus sp. HetDA_MAG_MS8]